MLEVKNLKRIFPSSDQEVIAIDDISFSVKTGQFVSVVGQSGSGKSTLLSLLGALDKPNAGSIEVDGENLAALPPRALTRYRSQKIGFVFQNYNLIPNLTATENVMLAMEFAGLKANLRRAKATALLEQVGLHPDQMDRKPGKLSGGQQQRVAIARALANKPALILADEPTGNLDSQTGALIFELLRELSQTEQTTIVVVTHDLGIAAKTDQTFRLLDGALQD